MILLLLCMYINICIYICNLTNCMYDNDNHIHGYVYVCIHVYVCVYIFIHYNVASS